MVSNLVARTGRIKTFQDTPEKGTMAPSCAMEVYQNNLFESIERINRYLRYGAGVKVVLDEFQERQPLKFDWSFYLDPAHPDFGKINGFQHALSSKTLVNPVGVVVEDSMEGDFSGRDRVSIEGSWEAVIKLAEEGRSFILDISALRPEGSRNALGLEASGPLSFLTIYQELVAHLQDGSLISFLKLIGQINAVLRRGGQYKNGIVCTSLKYTHPLIHQYLNYPLRDLPGGQKKSVRLDSGVLGDRELCLLIAFKVNTESVFLEKMNIDETLFANVCMEIQIRHRGACLISHVNCGQCATPEDLTVGAIEVMTLLCELHTKWRQVSGQKANIYLDLESDRQVGMGWVGFANFLSQQGVTFREHVEALEAFLDEKNYHGNSVARNIAYCLALGIQRAAAIAREHNLERAFTLAPTQTCAYNHTDLRGNTLCRSIDPPFHRRERRDSHSLQQAKFYYHGPVETMEEVGHDLHQRQWECWQRLMNGTGLAHTASFDLWREIDEDWLKDFILRSPLQTTYYNFADKLNQDYLNKGVVGIASTAAVSCDALRPGECSTCAE